MTIEILDKHDNFEDLGLFDKDYGKNNMEILFGYVLSNSLDPPRELNHKIKELQPIS